MIPLGPFVLENPIGRGGMAEVWKGHHLQGTPVAVKVLVGENNRQPLFVQAFRKEVRAVANLHHAGIVHVFDYGVISPEASIVSNGYLVVGSPYLVMELAEAGTLQDHVGTMSWPQLKRVLLELLDALAHAHAAGVIHRDLKPANVLLRTKHPFVVLTDFGLAHALDDESMVGEERAIGTAPFMAPEQFLCAWRDYGPWTDMYALGCLVYTMICAATPFYAKDFFAWRDAHFLHPLPSLYPRMMVPEKLQSWIHKLIAKEPQSRYQRAAEAAWDLQYLEQQLHPVPDFSDVTVFSPASVETLGKVGGEMRTEISAEPVDSEPLGLLASPEVIRSAQGSASYTGGDGRQGDLAEPAKDPLAEMRKLWLEFQTKPIPEHSHLLFAQRPTLPTLWENLEVSPVAHHLLGAGLGLFGLRAIPLVDREAERNVLWHNLVQVKEAGQARMVVLEGMAGYGKSRLAEWLLLRSHELGYTHGLKAFHSPLAGPRDGLESMLMRYLRCIGLSRAEILLRCQLFLHTLGIDIAGEALALTELLAPSSQQESPQDHVPAVRFYNPTERYSVVRYFLEGLSRDRVLVLWLDDVHWGLDTLGFCEHLLQMQDTSPAPILLVATVQQEILQERLAEQSLLQRMYAATGVERVEIRPLPPSHRLELVHELLALEPALAQRIVERTEGNPLFAVQLVGDWITRGILEPGEQGFRLRTTAGAWLPDSLHDVWETRITRVLEAYPPTARQTLELAALLGQEVDTQEWLEVCQHAGVLASLELVEALLHQRLARCHEEGPQVGWSFGHGMLRESLERHCKESGRWSRFQRCCAQMLATRHHPEAKERRGRHLLAAQDLTQALDALLDAVEDYTQTGDYLVALHVLDTCEQAVPESKRTLYPQFGLALAYRSRVVQLQGDYTLGTQVAAQAEGLARTHEWHDVLAEALLRGGNAARIQGKPDALAKLQEAESLFLQNQRGDRLGHTRIVLGYQLIKMGDWAGARTAALQALSDFQQSGYTYMQGLCYTLLGDISMHANELTEGEQCIRQAYHWYEQCGSRWGLACSLNGLGEIARLQERFDEAEAWYREAFPRYQAIGSGSAVFPKFNLSQILLVRQRYEEAEPLLLECLAEVRRQGRKALSASVHLGLLVCAAARRLWSEWEHHFFQVTTLLTATKFVDVDIPLMATRAAELAVAASQIPRACTAYALAIEQWRALGQEDKALLLSTRLQELGSRGG